MKVKQKLYYVDISGKLYSYTVTKITDTYIEVASDEHPEIKTEFTIEQAAMLFMQGSTIEAAQEEAEKRRAKMKSKQMGE